MGKTRLNFGEAITALKAGKCVARSGWNGKGMHIYLNKGSVDRNQLQQTPDNTIDGVPESLFETGDAGTVTRLPNLCMKTASGATLHGWLASQTDILAEDWEIVE